MKIEHIIEAISETVGKKIFDEWHHEGSVQYVDDDWLSIEIDGERYNIMVMQNAESEAEAEEISAEEASPVEAEESQEESEPEEEPKKRKKINHMQILSLHNAGWTNKQIADEMGLTPNQVSQSLSRSKKQMEAEE